MGSDSKTNGSGGGGDGGQIPASMKKVVQNVKEIVNNNCTDSEIYAVLRDCKMDPNDAVQRLLSQDTFHEVKRRRERRKEMKKTQEVKTRANHGTSNRGVIGGSEHYFGRSGSIQFSSNELGKAIYRKENGSVASIPYSASSTLLATRQTWNEQPSPQRSNCFNADNGRQSIGTGDMIDSSLQPSPGSQSTWVGATLGHVTMADIVRMGRPRSKGSQMPCETSNTPQDAVLSNSANYQIKPSLATSPSQFGEYQDLHSNLNSTRESGKKSSQHDFDNEWLVNDPITASSDTGATMYSNQCYLHSNRANLSNLSSNCWSDNILASESNAARENLSSDNVSFDQASNKRTFMNDFGGTSEHDDDLCKDASSPDSYQQIYEPQEGKERGSNISVPNPTASLSDDVIKAVSIAGVNLQQLTVGEERAVTPTEEKENCGVVLPNNLQAFSADCSHLSFGTYKSSKKALSQPQTSNSLTNDLEEALTTSNGRSSSTHLNSRDLVYSNEEQLEFDFDTCRATVDSSKYNPPNFLQTELRKIDIPEATVHGNGYVSNLSILGSSFKNIQQLSSALSYVIDPNARNLPPLPSEVQSHSNSMPIDLLPATIQSIKARDSAAFLASQSISSRYSRSASSIKNPTASISEALLGANLATGFVLKDHLSAHFYSQTGYPAITQGHTYTLSALQQPYLDVFHESHTGIKYNVPHYGASLNSLPLSGSYTGYQSLGESADIPGSFLHNLSSVPHGSTVGYDDFLRAQYMNGGANLNQLQQNGGSAMWAYGHGSRTISTIPDSAYYSLQGQNHQLAGYQQGQQHSHFQGAFRYPGIYSSQAGITIEQQQQQQQNLHDMILNGSQGSSSNQLPQIWQQSY